MAASGSGSFAFIDDAADDGSSRRKSEDFVWLRTKELSQSHKTVATKHTGCETKAFISDNSDLTRLKPFWAFYLEKEDWRESSCNKHQLKAVALKA